MSLPNKRSSKYTRLSIRTWMTFLHWRWNSRGSPILLEPEELEYSVTSALNNEHPRCLCKETPHHHHHQMPYMEMNVHPPIPPPNQMFPPAQAPFHPWIMTSFGNRLGGDFIKGRRQDFIRLNEALLNSTHSSLQQDHTLTILTSPDDSMRATESRTEVNCCSQSASSVALFTSRATVCSSWLRTYGSREGEGPAVR